MCTNSELPAAIFLAIIGGLPIAAWFIFIMIVAGPYRAHLARARVRARKEEAREDAEWAAMQARMTEVLRKPDAE